MPDLHTWKGTPSSEEIDLVKEKIRGFIFPNMPATEDEERSFQSAVEFQIAHEKSRQEQYSDIPDGASSFKIGDFSMTFDNGVNSSSLTRQTICPAAYSVLLRAGLLYRGL